MNVTTLLFVADVMAEALGADTHRILVADHATVEHVRQRLPGVTCREIDSAQLAVDWVFIGITEQTAVTILAEDRGEAGPSWTFSTSKSRLEKLAEMGCPVEEWLPQVKEPDAARKAAVDAALTDVLLEKGAPADHLICEAWIGQLVRDITHEFNNLLGGVMGLMEVARSMLDDPEVDKVLETAITRIHEFGQTVSTLLELGRNEVPEKEKTLPDVPVRKAMALLAHRLKRKHVHTQMQVHPAALVEVDVALVTLMFVKLIDLLWQSAGEGDSLDIEIGPATDMEGTVYCLTMGRSEHSRPLGKYWQDPRPQFFAEQPQENGNSTMVCLKRITALHGAQIKGPLVEEQAVTYRLIFPAANNCTQSSGVVDAHCV